MIYRLFLIFFFILSPVSSQAKSILILGDSISAAYQIPIAKGWVSLLEQRLQKHEYDYDIINASIVGETTFGGIVRLPLLLQQHQPDIVVIELGGNDGLVGIELEDIESNLSAMIKMSKHTGGQVLLVPMKIPPNYGRQYTKAFAEIYPRIAKMNNISLTKFIYQNVATNPDLMMTDGIHAVEAGHPIMLENVWPALSSLINLRQEKR